jgi:hypothetical protein
MKQRRPYSCSPGSMFKENFPIRVHDIPTKMGKQNLRYKVAQEAGISGTRFYRESTCPADRLWKSLEGEVA